MEADELEMMQLPCQVVSVSGKVSVLLLVVDCVVIQHDVLPSRSREKVTNYFVNNLSKCNIYQLLSISVPL